MFKLASSIIYLVLFIFIQNNFYGVSSFPSGAGSCDSTGIIAGHGAQAQSTSGGYSISATPKTDGSYVVSVSNTKGSPKGLLLYSLDSSSKATGTFTVDDAANFQIQSMCKDSTGVTHLNSNVKKTPMTFKWMPANGAKTGSVSFKALVVDKQTTWFMLQDLTLDLATGTSTSPVSNGTNTNSSPSSSPVVDNGFIAWIKTYKLFVIMMAIINVLYVAGSVVELMLKRQNSKARSFAKTVGGFGIAK